MEKRLLWSQTILSVYRYLERICGAIDKLVLRSGLNSGNVYASGYLHNNAFTITQRIIDLSQRKVTLINLKILIENSLAEIDTKDASILIERFFDGEKRVNLAKRKGISLRTVYRRIEQGLWAFSRDLARKGFCDLRIKYMLKNEAWINQVYNQLSQRDDDNFVLSKKVLASAVSM